MKIFNVLDVRGKLSGFGIAPLCKRTVMCLWAKKCIDEFKITQDDVPDVLEGATCVKHGCMILKRIIMF